MKSIMRLLGLAAGFIALALSIVSFVVPVLPTVPLLILTCFIFSKCLSAAMIVGKLPLFACLWTGASAAAVFAFLWTRPSAA